MKNGEWQHCVVSVIGFSHQQVEASLDFPPTGGSVIGFSHQQVAASLIFPPTGGSVIGFITNR
jgi:hypothetical protein